MGVIRTLILSGGGGRGAFHAGVYKYLCQELKPGVDRDHQGPWAADIVVGTSIGAVNGAAIIQGKSSEEIIAFWNGLAEHDIEGLPPTMTGFARWIVNLVMKNLIGVRLPAVKPGISTSPSIQNAFAPLPQLGKLGNWLLGRWSNLLDTGPLRKTIKEKLGLDEDKIRNSPQTLLINATNVSTGRRMTFSNRPVFRKENGTARPDVVEGISIQRILASCSIPMVYPWTADVETNAFYWDGAVVNNTPIGVAIDAAREFHPDDRMEVVVVMMTPWRDENQDGLLDPPLLPKDFGESITWALDWLLLASFRERLDLIDAYNRLAEIGRQIGDPLLSNYRKVQVTIVAPENFFPAARILDYDQWIEHLILQGYQAAARAFRKEYPSEANG
jgi:NTE family protein